MPSSFAFEDLVVYQKARAFRRRVYKLVKLLPKEERYALADQMRRAAISVTNNIAEGYGRFTFVDRIHFLRLSRGSVFELADDLNICEDEAYAKKQHLDDLRKDAIEVARLINGFIKYLRDQRPSKKTPRKQDRPPTTP